MKINKVTPYIHMNGTAERAIKLYQTALGAKPEMILRYGETPGSKAPPEQANLVMHACLKVGGGSVMLSDAPPNQPIPAEGNVQIAIEFVDVQEMTNAFDALAAEGEVVAPLHDAFWGSKFGIVTDRHGVRWLFNGEVKGAEE